MPHAACDERIAVDAVRASSAPHAFLSVSKQGVAGIVETTGNGDCHVVMPPHEIATSTGAECAALRGLSLPGRVMVHCSAPDAKEGKSMAAQVKAVEQVASLVRSGQEGLLGVLLPSFLLAGRQDLHPSNGSNGSAPGGNGNGNGHPRAAARAYGMSVTYPCMDWGTTASALESLALAVRERRAAAGAKRARRE